jgi:hypothetical protein
LTSGKVAEKVRAVRSSTAAMFCALVFAGGCGGSKASPAPPAATATSAPAEDLTALLVAKNVLPGFQPTGAEPVQQDDAEAWAKTNEEPDPTQLKALDFVAGARQDLVGPPGAYGLNLVERFRTGDEANERLAATVRDLGNGHGRFEVPGVPGAIGFESGSGSKRGRSVVFSKGETVFLLSHQVAKRTPSVAQLKAAIREWYAALPD